jgi:hypothetical protein
MRKPYGGPFCGVSKKQKHTRAQRGVRKRIEKNSRASYSIEVCGSIYKTQQPFIITRLSRNDNGLLLQPAAGPSADLDGIKNHSVTTATLTGNANRSAPADSTQQFA